MTNRQRAIAHRTTALNHFIQVPCNTFIIVCLHQDRRRSLRKVMLFIINLKYLSYNIWLKEELYSCSFIINFVFFKVSIVIWRFLSHFRCNFFWKNANFEVWALNKLKGRVLSKQNNYRKIAFYLSFNLILWNYKIPWLLNFCWIRGYLSSKK